MNMIRRESHSFTEQIWTAYDNRIVISYQNIRWAHSEMSSYRKALIFTFKYKMKHLMVLGVCSAQIYMKQVCPGTLSV